MRIDLEPAFVLHTQPFRDTSLLVDLLTLNYGRIRVVARGAKRMKSGLRDVLGYFTPLLVSWVGKGSLGTLTKVERSGAGMLLQGNSLLQGLYLNELMFRLLEEHVGYTKVYTGYAKLLSQLIDSDKGEQGLRLFGKMLLAELGYAVILDKDVDGMPIDKLSYYMFVQNTGLKKCYGELKNSYLGRHILAFDDDNLLEKEVLDVAKSLFLQAINPLLKRRLKSTEILA